MKIIPDTPWFTAETYKLTNKDYGKEVEGWDEFGNYCTTVISEPDIEKNRIWNEEINDADNFLVKWKFMYDENNT